MIISFFPKADPFHAAGRLKKYNFGNNFCTLPMGSGYSIWLFLYWNRV